MFPPHPRLQQGREQHAGAGRRREAVGGVSVSRVFRASLPRETARGTSLCRERDIPMTDTKKQSPENGLRRALDVEIVQNLLEVAELRGDLSACGTHRQRCEPPSRPSTARGTASSPSRRRSSGTPRPSRASRPSDPSSPPASRSSSPRSRTGCSGRSRPRSAPRHRPARCSSQRLAVRHQVIPRYLAQQRLGLRRLVAFAPAVSFSTSSSQTRRLESQHYGPLRRLASWTLYASRLSNENVLESSLLGPLRERVATRIPNAQDGALKKVHHAFLLVQVCLVG